MTTDITNEELLDLLKYEIKIDRHGTKSWYLDGECHRGNDMPAMEFADGSKFWYQHGEFHRGNNLPAIEYANGNKVWYEFNRYVKSYINPVLL